MNVSQCKSSSCTELKSIQNAVVSDNVAGQVEQPAGIQFNYPIGGIPVQFPCKPYPTQIQLMSKIIQALNRQENALLESPTGSGKSLALLCSTLAWLKKSKDASSASVQTIPVCKCVCHNQSPNVAGSNNTDVTIPVLKNDQLVVRETVITTTPNTGGFSMQSQYTSPLPAGVIPNQLPLAEVAPNQSPSVLQSTSQLKQIPQCNSHAPLINLEDFKQHQSSTVPSISQSSETFGSRAIKTQTITETDIQSNTYTVIEAQSSSGGTGMIINGNSSEIPIVIEDGNVSNPRSSNSKGDDSTPHTNRVRTTNGQKSKKRRKTIKISYEGDTDSESEQMDTQLMSKDHEHPMTVKSSSTTSGSSFVTKPLLHSSVGISSPVACKMCGCTGNGTTPYTNPAGPIRIFYGTRTHRQISQITHELKKTAYSSTPMVILASREHTCIHPNVSRSRKKNEDCKNLLDYKEGISCSFYYKVQQKLNGQNKLREYGYNSAWDIEELVNLGKKVKACPYYGIRALLEGAEIVFCPYNYLIDPMIRDQMLIKLEGQIVVFDEAHNMEDSAREAASGKVSNLQLIEVEEEISELLKCNKLDDGIRESYKMMSALCHGIIRWVEAHAETLLRSCYEEPCAIWNGEDFIPFLKKMGISVDTRPLIMNCLSNISDAIRKDPKKKEEEEGNIPTLSIGSLNLLETVFTILKYLFTFTSDYRVALKRTTIIRQKKPQSGHWRRRSRANPEKVWVNTLHFWCLNPAVAFSELNVARSIILTSGTLSPMSSFSSELGTDFVIQLEANHVISQSQTWIHTISHGPNGRQLNASYQFSKTFEFQDEVGMLVLKICQTVPYGILCFLSSYNMLEKLSSRWQDTGIWFQILKKKHIVCEPRAGDKEDFEIVMSSFYQHIEKAIDGTLQTELGDSEFQQDGALFLAVCRGKVSEGLDFTDDNARAVITIGIPFPSIRDKQITLKREYNDKLCHTRGLLSGSEWYEIQAYRALNQALGRCIRHKKDWGALIIVDERFGKGDKYIKGLSKWIYERVKHQPRFTDALYSLQQFTQLRQCNGVPHADSSSMNATVMNQTTPFDATMSVASPIRISESKPSSMLIPEPCTPKPDPLIVANITSPIPHSVPPHETNTTPWKSESIMRSSTPQPGKSGIHVLNPSALTSEQDSPQKSNSTSPLLFGSDNPVADDDTHTRVEQYVDTMVFTVGTMEAEVMQLDTIVYNTDAPLQCSNQPPLHTEVTKQSIIINDDDETPPITPVKLSRLVSSEDIKPTCTKQQTDSNSTTVLTSVSRNEETIGTGLHSGLAFEASESVTKQGNDNGPVLRRSVRRRGANTRRSVCTKNNEVDEEDFQPTKKKRKRKSELPAEIESKLSTLTCNCGNKIIEDVTGIKKENLISILTRESLLSKTVVKKSTLFSIINDDNLLYCIPEKHVTHCHFKKESSNYNAVWDPSLALCYSIIECRCGLSVGVKVHCSTSPDCSLVGKAIITTSISCLQT